jgi:hypothetical protein
MTEGSGMSYYPGNEYTSVVVTAVSSAAKISDFWKSFYRDNEKRKLDPFTPALRSKGEKARNRRKRK